MSLQLKKVVLYKHGVGYFERLGKIQNNDTINLQFRQSEMNDVLKSLTTIDLDGGIIASISYESCESDERKLKEMAIELSNTQTLVNLLLQIKGAHVNVTLESGSVNGKILGIDSVTKQLDNTLLTTDYLALFVDNKNFCRYNLMDIKNITLLDETVKDELLHLLEVLFSANKKEMKQLSIYTKGEGERRILASYVTECPVWKTSYRILLDDDKSLIQGWAIVDNTMDEDWNDISLTLVAGLPISFVHDLYTSRYKKRPVIEIDEEAAYAPPELEDAEQLIAVAGAMGDFDDDAFGGAKAPVLKRKSPSRATLQELNIDKYNSLQNSTKVHTHTNEISDLFQYEITHSVNVKRGQSALVPIVQTSFEGKRVAIFNADIREKNPMSAVLVKNTTGLTLEGGPVTVIEDNVYVGESMLSTLRINDEKILPYSVNLGCTINSDYLSEIEDVHFCKAYSGNLYLFNYRLHKKVYIITNKTDRNIDLFIDHRFIAGTTLTSKVKPEETTENFYRFRIYVPANQETKFEIVEKEEFSEIFALSNVNTDQIAFWLRKKYIDSEIRPKLEAIIQINAKIAGIKAEFQKHNSEKDEIFKNEARLRENLKSLGSSRDEKTLRDRYISALTKEEDKLAEIRAVLKNLKVGLKTGIEKLRERVDQIEFSTKLD